MKCDNLKEAVNAAKALKSVVEDSLREKLQPQIMKEADARIKAQVARMLEAEDEPTESEEDEDKEKDTTPVEDVDVDVIPAEDVEDEPTDDNDDEDETEENKEEDMTEGLDDFDDDIEIKDEDDYMDVDLPASDYDGSGRSEFDEPVEDYSDDIAMEDDTDLGLDVDDDVVGDATFDIEDEDDEPDMDIDDEYPMENRKFRGKAVNENLKLRQKLAEQRRVVQILMKTINDSKLAMQKHGLITKLYNRYPQLTENQRRHVALQFDKARDINMAKVIYGVIKEHFAVSPKISRHMTNPSKTVLRVRHNDKVLSPKKTSLQESKIPQAKRWTELVDYNRKK